MKDFELREKYTVRVGNRYDIIYILLKFEKNIITSCVTGAYKIE